MFDGWTQSPTRELTLFSLILILRVPGAPLSSNSVLLSARTLFWVQRGVCGLCQNVGRESVSVRGYVEPRAAVHTVAGDFDVEANWYLQLVGNMVLKEPRDQASAHVCT